MGEKTRRILHRYSLAKELWPRRRGLLIAVIGFGFGKCAAAAAVAARSEEGRVDHRGQPNHTSIKAPSAENRTRLFGVQLVCSGGEEKGGLYSLDCETSIISLIDRLIFRAARMGSGEWVFVG